MTNGGQQSVSVSWDAIAMIKWGLLTICFVFNVDGAHQIRCLVSRSQDAWRHWQLACCLLNYLDWSWSNVRERLLGKHLRFPPETTRRWSSANGPWWKEPPSHQERCRSYGDGMGLPGWLPGKPSLASKFWGGLWGLIEGGEWRHQKFIIQIHRFQTNIDKPYIWELRWGAVESLAATLVPIKRDAGSRVVFALNVILYIHISYMYEIYVRIKLCIYIYMPHVAIA